MRKNKYWKSAVILILVSVALMLQCGSTAYAAKKSTQSKVTFNLDKFITAHRNNDRNGVMEQLVAAKSNWRRTFTISKTSGINLLMIACQNAAEYDAMDAIYTLIENCPDLINARVQDKPQFFTLSQTVSQYLFRR